MGDRINPAVVRLAVGFALTGALLNPVDLRADLQTELERVSPPLAPAPIQGDGITAPAPAPPESIEQRELPASDVLVPRFAIERYEVVGNTLLKADAISKVLAPFTGGQRDFGDVQRALDALQQAYVDAGFGVVQVTLPEQELEAGVVQFQVAEAVLGTVSVEGNKIFDAQNIRASLPAVLEGRAPNTREIGANLKIANENPAKKTSVLLKPSATEGEIDATVRVVDENPVKWGLTLDNTGSPATGQSRIALSYQHANLFNRDQVLNLQAVTSPQNFKGVTIFGAGYHVPLYQLGASLDLFAGYA
ncbi:MAG: POTRA domain-containing protein, partial [Burkholderiales bacterium]